MLLPSRDSNLWELTPLTGIRLVALDVDGTSLTDDPDDPLAYLFTGLARSLSAKYHVRLTFATGRAFAGVAALYDSLTPHPVPLILYNGAVVYDTANRYIVRATTIRKEAAWKALKMISKAGAAAYVYTVHSDGRESNWTFDLVERVHYFGAEAPPPKEFNALDVIRADDPESALTIDPVAIVVLIDNLSRDATAALVDSIRALPGIRITTSGTKYLEITAFGVNKAQALQHLARLLQIEQAEVAAIGDNDNDVEMLAWAGCGVSVANGSTAAQSASRYVTYASGASGAIEFLSTLREAYRFRKAVPDSRPQQQRSD